MTTPNEKQFYDSLSPELKKRVDEHKALDAAAREKRERIQSIQVSCRDPVAASKTPSDTRATEQKSAQDDRVVWTTDDKTKS